MKVFIGLGSNLGDKIANIKKALKLLDQSEDIKVNQVASLYQTEPVGIRDQPWFVNTVARMDTDLGSEEIYHLCKGIENLMGRMEGPRWGPRLIDLDILLYGQEIIETENLTIPHPQLHKRRFVLVPLVELDKALIHPQLGKPLVEILNELEEEKVIKLTEIKAY